MNCEAFRDAVLAEPMGVGQDRDRHLQRCDECAAFAARVMRFERRLEVALSVPVPESLSGVLPEMPVPEARGGAATVVEIGSGRDRRTAGGENAGESGRYGYWAMAAALVVAVAAAALLRPSAVDVGGADSRLLAEQVFEHVGPELFAMKPASTAVPASRLDAVVPAALATMEPGIGLVSYARSCEINGRVVPHLVVQGERGPVTILLLPGETLASPARLSRDGLDVVVFPVGEGGSVALIGRGQDSIDAVRDRAHQAIAWTT